MTGNKPKQPAYVIFSIVCRL